MDFSLAASYLLLFFTASFLGWCMEVTCKLIQFGRFINRGFLIGPWCPIYGFGTVLITLLLSRFTDDPLAVFALAMLLCGTLEYRSHYKCCSQRPDGTARSCSPYPTGIPRSEHL